MKFYRVYSSLIPKNTLKDKYAVFHKSKNQLPLPDQILHPFYVPSKNEEFVACFKEVRPSLLDGRRIVPCLMKESQVQGLKLVNCSLQFDTVRGVNRWLQSFRASRMNRSYVAIDENQAEDFVKPSRLDRAEIPQLNKLSELFGVQHSRRINSETLDTIVDQLCTSRDFPVFCEDIYFYLLQHHVNSIEKIIAMMDSIRTHIHSNIDQFKVVEGLILQILLSVKKNNLTISSTFILAFEKLLTSVNERFHLASCESQFQPIVSQNVLEYFINIGNFNQSKAIIKNLISSGFLPSEKLVVEYLQLLDQTFGSQTSDGSLLTKFAYISDMSPVFKAAQSASLFYSLISYCRHINEVINLIELAKGTRNPKEILDVTVEALINKVGSLGSSRMERSSNLCSLYHTILPYYNNNLPDKFLKSFVYKLAQQNNFSMIANILERQDVVGSPGLLLSILSHSEKVPTKREPIQTYENLSRRKFIKRFLLPGYTGMDPKSRAKVLLSLDDSISFCKTLKLEISIFDEGNTDILEEFMSHGSGNNLLSSLPTELWDKISTQPNLMMILNKA